MTEDEAKEIVKTIGSGPRTAKQLCAIMTLDMLKENRGINKLANWAYMLIVLALILGFVNGMVRHGHFG